MAEEYASIKLLEWPAGVEPNAPDVGHVLFKSASETTVSIKDSSGTSGPLSAASPAAEEAQVSRLLDPRERAHARAARDYERAVKERTELVLKGAGKLTAEASAVAEAEKKVVAASRISQQVVCAFCKKTKINVGKDPHYRLSVTALVRHYPEELMPYTQNLSVNARSGLEVGSAGVVVQLRPPDAGQLAICVDCVRGVVDYLDEQLVEDDSYRLHLRGLTATGELGPDDRDAKKPVTARRPKRQKRG